MQAANLVVIRTYTRKTQKTAKNPLKMTYKKTKRNT
jgi:hypothetical protein